MKNKQINKVLLMFFLSFTLFFSVSNAFTLEANVDYTYVSDNDSTISSFASYSSSTINTICINYFNDNLILENINLCDIIMIGCDNMTN